MKDLNILYQRHQGTKSFNNFFKTAYYKAVFDHLIEQGVPPQEILHRTRSGRGVAAQVMAHPLVCMAFVHWLDLRQYVKTIHKLMAQDEE